MTLVMKTKDFSFREKSQNFAVFWIEFPTAENMIKLKYQVVIDGILA